VSSMIHQRGKEGSARDWCSECFCNRSFWWDETSAQEKGERFSLPEEFLPVAHVRNRGGRGQWTGWLLTERRREDVKGITYGGLT